MKPIVDVYFYNAADGGLARKKYRHPDKSFTWFTFVPATNMWIEGAADASATLYKLEVLAAETPRFILITEGEKDCDAVNAIGLLAVTSGGSRSWRHHHSEQLQHYGVRLAAVLRDNDPAGLEYAHTVARENLTVGIGTKVVLLPNLGYKQDVSDFLAAGGTADDIWMHTKRTPVISASEIPAPTHRPSMPSAHRPIDRRLIALYRETLKLPPAVTRGDLMVQCPFHVDGDPSLHLDLDKLIWYCHGCGRGGDPTAFFMRWKTLHEQQTLTRSQAEFRLGVTYL